MTQINKTVDGGQNWTVTGFSGYYGLSMDFIGNMGYYSFFPGGSNFSYFLQNGTQVYATKKYIFTKDNYEYPNHTTNIKFVNDSTGFITCKDTSDNAVILKTSDFGHNWVEVKVLNGNLFKDITFISDSIGFVVGTNGYILKTVNMGENWQFINSNSSYALNSIDFSNDTIGCIVGNNGIILKSNDLGQNWVQESFINTNDLIYVRLFENGLTYVNDKNGHLYSKNSHSGVIENWRSDILVYPNPSDEVINISIPENIQYFNTVLYDMQGQRIRTSCEEKLSLIGLTKGIYILEIVTKQGTYRKKIIKV